jgi:hypothetical protein
VVGVAGDLAQDFGPAVGAVGTGGNRLVLGKAIEVVVLLAVDAPLEANMKRSTSFIRPASSMCWFMRTLGVSP